MKVNVNSILHALRNIQDPTREGEVMRVVVPDRFPPENVSDYKNPTAISRKTLDTLTLTSVRFADSYRIWYEWEIEI